MRNSSPLLSVLLGLVILVQQPEFAFAASSKAESFRSQHHQGLTRTLNEPFRGLWDRDHQLRVNLPDRSHWRRVRFHHVKHFTGFKNSKAATYSAVFAFETQQVNPTSAQCVRAFEKEQQKRIRQFKVEHSPLKTVKKSWKGKDVYSRQMDGFVRVFFSKYRFSAAWTAYPAYENGCVVHAFVSRWKKEGGLAQATRDRWVAQKPYLKISSRRVPERRTRK